jgi:hypothetical protein
MSASKDDLKRLRKAFAQAAEIAGAVPEPMQEAAFNRALDEVLGVAPVPEPKADSPEHPARKSRGGRQPPKTRPEQTEGPAESLIAQINRTNYPEIFSAGSVLDRALRVLRLAEEEFGVEFLSAPEIAQVLKEKFRLPTTHQAVRQALAARPQYVDTQSVKRGSRGRAVVAYRIMSPGADFLDAGGTASEETQPAKRAPTRRRAAPRRRSTAKKKSKAEEREQPDASGESRSSASTPRSRLGPKRALGELIAEGFFDEPRTIADAKERLRHKKGLSFTLQDLSPALVRLLREGSLDREQGDGGQYEYRRP